MPSSVLAPLDLTADERAQLESPTRRRSSAEALAMRPRIALLAAQGLNNTEIASELKIHRNAAGKSRSRFLKHRLDGLLDEPRPGRPRTISDERVEEVVIKTLETTPKDATHWRRLPGGGEAVVGFVAGLAGPVRVTYEAGPTGFVLARTLRAIGVDCLVCAPGGDPARRKRSRQDRSARCGAVGAAAGGRRAAPSNGP